MSTTLQDDLLASVTNNYYKDSDGNIIKIIGIELLYLERGERPYFQGRAIERFEQGRDIFKNESLEIHLHDLARYTRITENEIQKLRNLPHKT